MEINRELIEGVGIITPPRRPNAPRPRPRTRTVGTALDTLGNPVLTSRGGATVKVTHPNGLTTYEPASRYRTSSTSNTRVARRASAVKSTYNAIKHLTAADLPAIQNYEDD